VISSIGFGGEVVAIVQPIQDPIRRMAIKAMQTGIAMTQNWALARPAASVAFIKPIVPSHCGKKSVIR
jgi:hypothetical protein